MAPRKSARPKPFSVGRVRVRVKRGPRSDGRWYWRADHPVGQGRRQDVWNGWGTRDEVERTVLEHLAQHDPHSAYDSDQVVTMGDLLDVWLFAQESREDIAEDQVAADGSYVQVVRKANPRRGPLHPTVQAEVLSWDRGEPDQTVHGQSPRSMAPNLRRRLADACEALGLPRIAPGGFRGSVTDALYRTGHTPDQESALLGHSAETALRHNRPVTQEDLRGAVISSGLGVPTTPGTVIPLRVQSSDD